VRQLLEPGEAQCHHPERHRLERYQDGNSKIFTKPFLETHCTNAPQINPNYGDEYRIKNAQVADVERWVDKEIGNNVQTVPYTVGTGPDEKYALYNFTRDHLTDFEGEILNQYVPENPYEWLEEFWPEGTGSDARK
jgi:hypothetical protein